MTSHLESQRPPAIAGPSAASKTVALPGVKRLIAVVAHPDDESFGLGGILGAFSDAATECWILCFTRGEASSLGRHDDLATTRARELRDAAVVLGVRVADLLQYPDGSLSSVPLDELAAHVTRVADAIDADLLLVFDEGGVTGHPDHIRATEAALAAARDGRRLVLAWAIPNSVAGALNAEFGSEFRGRSIGEIDFSVDVDRARQQEAMSCHASQLDGNPVPARRIQLTGPADSLRYLRE